MLAFQQSLQKKITPPKSSGDQKKGTIKEKTPTQTEQLQQTPPSSKSWSEELLGLLSGSFPNPVQPKQNSLILTGKRKRKKRNPEDKENGPRNANRKRINIEKRKQRCQEKITAYRQTFAPASPNTRKVLKPLPKIMAQGTDTKIMETRNPGYVVGINKELVEQKSVEAYFNKFKSPHVMSASSIVVDGFTRFTTMPKAKMDLHDMLRKIRESKNKLITEENINLRLFVYKSMLRGLDTMHSHKTVHGDIKTPNGLWFRRENGTHILKVSDFSRSKFTGSPVKILSSSAEHTHPDILQNITALKIVDANPKHDLFTIASLLFRELTNSHHSHYSTIAKKDPKIRFKNKNNNTKYVEYYKAMKDEVALKSIEEQIEKQKKLPHIKLVEPDQTEHTIPSNLTPILKWCLRILNRNYKYNPADAMKLDQTIERVFIENKSRLQTETGTNTILDKLLLH